MPSGNYIFEGVDLSWCFSLMMQITAAKAAASLLKAKTEAAISGPVHVGLQDEVRSCVIHGDEQRLSDFQRIW